jgi:hypothetical protein
VNAARFTARFARTSLAALALAYVAGCGSNPPCSVTPAQVDSAKADAKAAEAKLDLALEEKARLEAELADIEEKVRQGQEELERRSGRGGEE